eukprot:419457_1
MANTAVYTNNGCNTEDVTQCESMKRIQMVLEQSTSSTNNNENKEQSLIKIESVINDNYTTTHLMNDYNHIKYHHKVDNNANEFAKVYSYFKQNTHVICNIHNCKYIDKHYMDRSKIICQCIDSYENCYKSQENCIFNLISKIHVYFFHDINRLPTQEKQNIAQQHLNNSSNHDQKQKITNLKRKYIEPTHCIDFQAIQQLLSQHNIPIDVNQIQVACVKYKDKNQFINDLIDAYYSTSDQILPLENEISVNHLPQDHQIRQQIYGILLFKYIRKHELNNDNFVRIAEEIIVTSYPQLNIEFDIDDFIEIARNENLNGKIFIKGHSCFKNSTRFAKLFESISGYTKKTFAQIYVKLNQWSIDPNVIHNTKIKNLNCNVSATPNNVQDNKENTIEQVSIEDDIYKIGKRFFYWKSMKTHPLYIEAKYSDLKTELLQSDVIGSDFNVNMYNHLYMECKMILKSDIAQSINGNGYFQQIYNIKLCAPFSGIHLMALKLYTDYTNLCSILCSTLRSENKNKICEIANWAKLLCECVQCYGTSLNASKCKRYYRGVQNVFTFTMFVTRFNLPTSTTTDFNQAVEFCVNGLVLELQHYRNTYDVFKFDCYALSDYDTERETLFFGGNTVLQISCIWQPFKTKWISYGKYMIAIDAILRMIHGVTIKNHKILENKKHQQTMYELLNHIFCDFNGKKSMLKK